MKLTNFEQTGLDIIEKWIEKYNIKYIGAYQLKEALKSVNLSFVLEGINRVQSMLLCELKDSYVQQSQRYVVMGPDGYVPPHFDKLDKSIAENLIRKAFDLYERMTEYTDDVKAAIANGTKKGRPQISDYKYGIPIEDARYILPLAATTNISISMSGDKLYDLFYMLNDSRYSNIMEAVKKEIIKVLPENLIKLFPDGHLEFDCAKVMHLYNENYFNKLNETKNVTLYDAFNKLDRRVACGALTSTQEKSPVDVINEWPEDEKDTKAFGVNKRVLGYGHTGIAEQARTSFGVMCSLTCYHQQIRHRLPSLHREELIEIIKDKNREVVIPTTIKNSIFYEEYTNLVNEFKKFRDSVIGLYDNDDIFPMLLNCEQVKFFIGTNARMDVEMLAERTCMTAQWEIRELSVIRLQMLRQLSDQLYKKAIPPCVYGTCKEGALSCKKQDEVKKFFNNI